MDVFGQRIILGAAALAHHARTGAVLAKRFCFTSSSSARNRRLPAGTSNIPVSWLSGSSTGRTLRTCRNVRGEMSSAQFLDRDARLHAFDVGLAQNQLTEGDITRRAERDILNGGSHVGCLRDKH